jgi:hypothetical protein
MSKKKTDWIVLRLRGARAAQIGMVKATDASKAIAAAVEEFELDPRDANRLIAHPM